jgi:hypothetical protein
MEHALLSKYTSEPYDKESDEWDILLQTTWVEGRA